MQTILCFVIVFLVAFAPSENNGQPFAIISNSAARSLQAKANLPAAKATLASAMSNMNRPPNPVPTIDIAGRLPQDPVYKQTSLASTDLPIMADLALAYRLTSDKKYLDAATRYLRAWASTYKTGMNPINDQDFYYFFIANDLVQADLPADVQAITKSFVRQYAEAYLNELEKSYSPGNPQNGTDQNNKKPDPTRNNNFQSHRIKLGTLAAFATGDKTLIARARAGFDQQVTINIYPDGTVWDFHERDAMHYVIYDLEPLLLAAMAAKAHGEDWFSYKSPSGSSLKGPLDWLIPYAESEKTHVEFVHSTVPFDATRAKAGVKGFSGPWDPKGSVTTFAYASVLDPRYRKVLEDVETHTNATPPPFVELVFE
jgi:hypothetical protein